MGLTRIQTMRDATPRDGERERRGDEKETEREKVSRRGCRRSRCGILE